MGAAETKSLADGYVRWIRSQVGSQLIYLVYAAGVIFDEQGRILVQTRYDFDWLSIPGGAMELRESLTETALREVHEETGIHAEIKGLAGILSHPRYNLEYPNGDRVQQWTAIFWGTVKGGELRPDGGETLSALFVVPDDFFHKTHTSHQEMVRCAMAVRDGHPAPLEAPDSFPPLKPYFPILREHVGHQPVILPGGMAIIEDDEGRILMTRRADFDCWDFPSGFADLGETTTANVIREVQEETGLIVEPYAITGLYSDPRWYYAAYPNSDIAHSVGVTMACRVTGGELNINGNDNENTACAFLPVEEILSMDGFEATRQVIEDYLDRAGWPHIR